MFTRAIVKGIVHYEKSGALRKITCITISMTVFTFGPVGSRFFSVVFLFDWKIIVGASFSAYLCRLTFENRAFSSDSSIFCNRNPF